MSESVTQKTKKRNWTIVCYPESLPKDWKDSLRESGLQVAISPLHDKDLNPDGTEKKPHYHLILIYSGPTSYNVVLALTKKLNAPIPKALEAVRGMYRYFTHKDNPEKYQYDEKDIECLNGFDILDFVELTKSEILKTKKSLQLLIRQKDFHEYAKFMDYCLENLSDTEYNVASNHTYFFDKYLTSRRHSEPGTKTNQEEVEKLVDQAMGKA